MMRIEDRIIERHPESLGPECIDKLTDDIRPNGLCITP